LEVRIRIKIMIPIKMGKILAITLKLKIILFTFWKPNMKLELMFKLFNTKNIKLFFSIIFYNNFW